MHLFSPGGRTPSQVAERDEHPRRRRLLLLGLAIGVPCVIVAVGGIGAYFFLQPDLGTSQSGIADISVPPTARIVSVSATSDSGQPIPVRIVGTTILPQTQIQPGTRVIVTAHVSTPRLVAWSEGSTATLTRTVVVQPATLASPTITTTPAGAPVAFTTTNPIRSAQFRAEDGRWIATRVEGTTISFRPPSPSGTGQLTLISAAWMAPSPPIAVGWFTAGNRPTVISYPSNWHAIAPNSQLTVVYSTQTPGFHPPVMSPPTPGVWALTAPTTYVFSPTQPGFAPGSRVHLTLPAGFTVSGSAQPVLTFSVSLPSPVRATQILADLGYLPFRFVTTSAPARTIAAQTQSVFAPPAGAFHWAFPRVPSALIRAWKRTPTLVTKGALMAFQRDAGLSTTGILDATTWHRLLEAEILQRRNRDGYTFVSVRKTLPETLTLWHNGSTRVTALVNTGIPQSPTAIGLYPVYLRYVTQTMSGTNPDGTKYRDPGIPWVSYFNGGDALHGYLRPTYGSPQSLGCVEMPYATAGKVWPFTPIGTLVDVH